jgi:lysine 6-dehydrogenase
MWEKTLRYPGHVEKIKVLEGLGFFDERQVSINGTNVSPRKVTVKLLEQKLRRPEVKDVVVLKVEVSGVKNGRQVHCGYHMLDFYDDSHGVTAMARTTAYPASIIAQLMLRHEIEEKGVIPPERIGMHDELFRAFLEELEERGIRITEEDAR